MLSRANNKKWFSKSFESIKINFTATTYCRWINRLKINFYFRLSALNTKKKSRKHRLHILLIEKWKIDVPSHWFIRFHGVRGAHSSSNQVQGANNWAFSIISRFVFLCYFVFVLFYTIRGHPSNIEMTTITLNCVFVHTQTQRLKWINNIYELRRFAVRLCASNSQT